MPDAPSPSGLPGVNTPVPKNRWLREIQRRPKASTAAEGFAAHIAGMLLLMTSMFVMIAGLVMVFGSMGSGWQGRASGVALVLGGAAVFAAGRWLLDQYAVQRPH